MLTFSADTTNLLFKQLNGTNSTIPDTNFRGLVNDTDLKTRFFADILKDGPGGNGFYTKIRTIYSPKGYNPSANWQAPLDVLETHVFNNESVKAKTTLLKNIIKTSTVGSNIKISHATNVFWESGFGSAKIMATPIDSCEKYQTPAAQLDSLGKEDATNYWPTEYGVTFDSAFLEAIGFPAGMRWEYNPGGGGSARGGAVTITYSDVSSLIFNVKPGWNNEKTKRENGANDKYLEGNNSKNTAIMNTSINNNEIIKYVETKEFGDVAQVLVYLAYVLAHLNTEPRTSSVMITTDGVVHLLNVLFNLSSIYTGSRRGVESGCCNLYSYLAGDVNLEIKFKNMIENYYLRIKSQLTATKFGFTIMLNNPSQFWYYRKQGDLVKKTNGAFKLKPDVKNGIRAFFNDMIGIIDGRIRRLDELTYPTTTTTALTFQGRTGPAANTDVDIAFTEWSQGVDTQCKIPQILTKLTNNQYILHPGGHPFLGDILPVGDILGNYTQLFINDTITIATVDNLKDAIRRGDQIDIEDVFSGGGRHRVIRKSNNNLSGGGGPGGEPGHEGSYYDYIFLCYVNYTMFQNITTSIDDYSHEFAFLYDWTASKIDPKIGGIPFHDFNDWFGYTNARGDYVSGKTDNDIYSEGEKLQKYVYFADDYDAEEQQLEAEALSSVWHGWTQVSAVSAKGVAQPMSQFGMAFGSSDKGFGNFNDEWENTKKPPGQERSIYNSPTNEFGNSNYQFGNSNNQSIQQPLSTPLLEAYAMSQFGNNNNSISQSIQKPLEERGPDLNTLTRYKTKPGSETRSLTPEVKAMIRADDPKKGKKYQSTKLFVEAPGNNSIMSPEEWDLFNVAFSRDNSNKLSEPKLASPDKSPELKKRRTRNDSPLQSFNPNNSSWDLENRDQIQPGIYGNTYFSPITTPVTSPRTENLSRRSTPKNKLLTASDSEQDYPDPHSQTTVTADFSQFRTPPVSPPEVTVRPKNQNPKNQNPKNQNPKNQRSLKEMTWKKEGKNKTMLSLSKELDKYIETLHPAQQRESDNAGGKYGGKRRTMKAKKYLKNNRKKTLRKNNKKTIRKTIRKNKKTRKSKH